MLSVRKVVGNGRQTKVSIEQPMGKNMFKDVQLKQPLEVQVPQTTAIAEDVLQCPQ